MTICQKNKVTKYVLLQTQKSVKHSNMNKCLFYLLIFLFIASCKKSKTYEDSNSQSTFSDLHWDRILIPEGGQVQAVAGNIDDTLLVSTLYNTYLVTNKGKTITRTSTHLNNTPGFYVVGDTIYALSADSYDERFEKHYASIPSYYTINKGVAWHPAYNKNSLFVLTGEVTTKENITIKLNYHKGSDKNGKGDNFVHRSTISRTENGNITLLDHPIINEQPINLYLDNKERLYILTGGSFSEAGLYISPPARSQAYLYISKKAI